jgi:hypothetical protein
MPGGVGGVASRDAPLSRSIPDRVNLKTSRFSCGGDTTKARGLGLRVSAVSRLVNCLASYRFAFNLDPCQKSAAYSFGGPWFERPPLHCCGQLLRLQRLYSSVRFFVSQFISPHSKTTCPSATDFSKSEPSLSRKWSQNCNFCGETPAGVAKLVQKTRSALHERREENVGMDCGASGVPNFIDPAKGPGSAAGPL